MDFLAAVIFLIFLWNAQVRKEGFFPDYLSMHNTRAIKGILAVLVVLHHMYQRVNGGLLFFLFDNVGVFCVCVFFFFSGYGLLKSSISKPDYSSQLLCRRIPSILIPFCFLAVLYWGLSFVTGDGYTVAEVLTSFVNGFPVVENGWYLLCILVYYGVFYLSLRLFPQNTAAVLWSNTVFAVLWAILCFLLGYGMHWYNMIIAFPAGLFWGAFESKCLPCLQKYYWWCLGAGALGCGGAYILGTKTASPMMGILLFWAAGLFFLAVVLLILMKFRFHNPVLSFLGSISFELYGIHGLFVLLYRSDLIYMESPVLWTAAVLFSSVAASWILHPVFQYSQHCIPSKNKCK